MPHRIIVLGMYRSGTSLTTALTQRWGAYVGQEQDLFEDRYGYLEHLALQKLNDELLGSNDRVPTPIESLVEKSHDPIYQARAKQILDAMDDEAQSQQAVAWAWKDPRLPLALPFWANLWGDVIYVITVRHPVETILSAAEMDGIPADQLPFSAGFAYWQYCMLNILALTQASRRKFFIAYDQLIVDPQTVCTRLGHFLDQQCGLPAETASQRVAAMTPHIQHHERHYHQSQALAEMPQATREQRALYNFLRVKTLYPDEAYHADDFALYPGWLEYLRSMDQLLTLAEALPDGH
ncbi:MAG: sulfotransferase [Chloroflexi bacterium]|nr:sulfotransferase [Chloroflexota bacterium]